MLMTSILARASSINSLLVFERKHTEKEISSPSHLQGWCFYVQPQIFYRSRFTRVSNDLKFRGVL